MPRSEAHIPSPAAERYAKQLTNHAARMGARSDWTPPHGMVEFPQGGTCRIIANPGESILIVEAATLAQLVTIQSILASDIQRFGQRQGMDVTWSAAQI